MPAQRERVSTNLMNIWRRVVLVVACLVALGAPAEAQIPAIDLGTLGGGYSEPSDISESGIVVGTSTIASGDYRAFLWSEATGMVNLGTLGGEYSFALRVNEAGVVIGHSQGPNGIYHGFRWSQATGMQNLTPPGMDQSYAVAINDQGEIAIHASAPGSTLYRTFRWSPTEGYVEIPGPAGDSMLATDMNDAGEIIGYAGFSLATPIDRAFFWSPATGTIDIGILDGLITRPLKINNASEVIGRASNNVGHARAFYWSRATGMVDAGLLEGSDNTALWDLNLQGTAVGMASKSNVNWTEPIMWTIYGGLQKIDLGVDPDAEFPRGFLLGINDHGHAVGEDPYQNAVVWTLEDGAVSLGGIGYYSMARDITNQGMIMGISWSAVDDNYHAVIWRQTPVSPPNTPIGAAVNVTTAVPLPDGSAGDVSITFSQVDTAGATTITASSDGPLPHTAFTLTNPQVYYEIETTADFTGTARVCLGWSEGQVADELTVSLFHYTGNEWVEITEAASRDTVGNRLCGITTSFSPFALFDRVKFPFVGFLAPIENGLVVNAAKAGSAIPVKFSLGGDRGMNIFAPGFPRAQLMQCDTGAPIDTIDETVSASSSPLSYDPANDRYTYVWKTDKAWANSCRQLQVKFTDGATYTAKFTFSK